MKTSLAGTGLIYIIDKHIIGITQHPLIAQVTYDDGYSTVPLYGSQAFKYFFKVGGADGYLAGVGHSSLF
jgi:hypothetical protein